ncbi:MAG TPA: glycosyltransferase family 4 protein [Micromonosporaceae bacterium]|jgi:glycosyltransferase involved in cell wall biosynthesis
MKVVVAHNRYSAAQPSGENAVVAAEIDELGRAGVEVIPFLRSSDEIGALPAAQRAALVVSPAYAGRAQRELRELLDRERPDAVHLHNPYPLLSPWVVRTAQARGVPVVHTLHNFRQTCVNGLFHRDGHDCHDCVGRALPTPAVRHACYRGSRVQSAVMATTLALHRGTWRSLDRVLALTPAMAAFAGSLGVPPERVVVRPNAVPDPGPNTQAGQGFFFAARLSAEKGVTLLLDAWQRHEPGTLGPLRIAGDGPLAELVRARAAARDDISYLGRLAQPEVATAMRGAAVVVVPSTWDEVCPTVAIEALANARPVLGTARGGLPWLIGDAGWTAQPTVEALAAALPVAHAEAAGFVARARQAYEARFTPAVATRTLLEVYRAVSGTRPRPSSM